MTVRPLRIVPRLPKHRRRPGHRGLTLVEVLAVVVILGLIAGTLALNFSGVFRSAKRELAKSGIALIQQRIEFYRSEHGEIPPADQGLAVLTDGRARPTDSWYVGPDQLLDPWGRRYEYLAPGSGGHEYEILSFGADGMRGGEADDADISSTNLRSDEDARR